MPSLLDLVYVRAECLIIPDGNGFFEIIIVLDVLKMVVLAKLGVFGCLDELFKDLFLVVHGSMHTFPDLLIDVACEGFGQK
jgi:hypothetical protein